jgi:DNA-binding transcriptional LysR family regulator
MDMKELGYFLAVAEAGSLGRAAARVGLAQSPLGRRIARLERELGGALFERSRQGVRLTPFGIAFHDRAADLVARAERAVAEAQRMSVGTLGHVAIGYVDEAMHGDFPRRLTRFLGAHQGITASLRTGGSAPLARLVEAGRLDLALIVGPPPSNLLDVAVRHFDHSPAHAVLGHGHPLATRSAIRLADLADETLIVGDFDPASGFYIQFAAMCRRAGLAPSYIADVIPNEMVAHLVAAGLGVTVGCHDAYPPWRPDIVVLPIDEADAVFERCIVWSPGNLTPAARRCLDVLTATTAA